MNSIIILTATVNVRPNINCIYQNNANDRINTYLKSILQWLYKTNFNIILVENSGYGFTKELNAEIELYKNRFEIISFKENEVKESKYLMNNVSKGDSEIFAINYAFIHSKLLRQLKPIFIIKITCRFFISELEEYLQNLNLNNYACLSQYDANRCEMIGCHVNLFKYIFNVNTHNKVYNNIDLIENVYKTRINYCQYILKYNVLRCKNFNIEETQRGGMNQKYNNI